MTDPRTRGVAQAAPRAMSFLARSWVKHQPLSMGLAAQVLLDEVVIAAMKNPRLIPTVEDCIRAGDDMRTAFELYDRRGWLDDPGGYHVDPPPIDDATVRREVVLRHAFEHLSFESGYEPPAGEPGADRWMAYEANREAHAWVVRHRHDPRNWVIGIHGFGMGSPVLDLRAFRAATLHRELGLNLLLPVLPLHGPRKAHGSSGEGFMSIDLIDSVHGLAQAAWDIRRMIRWARGQGAERIAVYGLSLGGYTAALVSSLEDGLDAVIAGIPATNIPDLYRRHSPPDTRRRARRVGAIGPQASAVHTVVSPLSLRPRVPWSRRFIFAGLGDRMSTSGQARRLWHHWDQPQVSWYPGGHVGFFWDSSVSAFVVDALRSSGLVPSN